MTKIVVGLFDNFNEASQAVDELVRNGFRREDISLVANDKSGEYGRYFKERGDQGTGDVSDGAVSGAGIGAVLGGLGGLLVGLGALAIPGIGPVLAAGPLITALAGAGIGAAAGGLLGALVDAGIPEEQAQYYTEGVRRGGTLVTVSTPNEMAQQAVDILNRHNPVDVKRRAQEWQSGGWTPTGMESMRREDMSRTSSEMRDQSIQNRRDEATFPVVEEELRVGKREVDTGGVRVTSRTEEKPVEEDVTLHHEEVNVERRPVDRPANPEDIDAFKDRTFEVRATSEEPVVEKSARVVEEVQVDKDVEEHTETIRDSVRRQDVDVEHLGDTGMRGTTGTTGMTGYDEYEPMWRSHYQTTYTGTGHTYDEFQPAYHYGYDLASDPRYRGRDWTAIEPEARRDWEMRYHDSAWDDFKDAVRQAWLSVTGQR